MKLIDATIERRILEETLYCAVVMTLRFHRRISCLGEKDGSSTAAGAVLGVTVAANNMAIGVGVGITVDVMVGMTVGVDVGVAAGVTVGMALGVGVGAVVAVDVMLEWQGSGCHSPWWEWLSAVTADYQINIRMQPTILYLHFVH